MKGEIYNEGKIFCKAYLREMQGYQEKRKRQNYLRESETQTETGLILLCISVCSNSIALFRQSMLCGCSGIHLDGCKPHYYIKFIDHARSTCRHDRQNGDAIY